MTCTPPGMPLAHALLASQCATGRSSGECSQWFSLAGSHNAWDTSLDKALLAHAICLGPTSMIPLLSIFLAEVLTRNSVAGGGSSTCHTSCLPNEQAGNWTQPHLLQIRRYPCSQPSSRAPGLRVSVFRATVTSLEIPSKGQTRAETHVLLFLGQLLQKVHHFFISQVTGTLPLSRGRRWMMMMSGFLPYPAPPSGMALTAWVSESMPPPCSARRRQASSTPQWAAACKGVQPSPSRSSVS